MKRQYEDDDANESEIIKTKSRFGAAPKYIPQQHLLWSTSPSDTPDWFRHAKYPRKPQCIGILVAIANWGVWYAIKEKGESWDGSYFR